MTSLLEIKINHKLKKFKDIFKEKLPQKFVEFTTNIWLNMAK